MTATVIVKAADKPVLVMAQDPTQGDNIRSTHTVAPKEEMIFHVWETQNLVITEIQSFGGK